jgi:acyl dehydratase
MPANWECWERATEQSSRPGNGEGVTIRLDAIGVTTSITHEVSVRWPLAYASALNFEEAAFIDDAREGGLAVVPTFCCCLEWSIAEDIRRNNLGLNSEELRRAVHVLQDSRFHQPIRPGMVVETTGAIEFLRATSAGVYVLTRYTHRESGHAEVLATSFHGAMIRGARLDTESAGASPNDLDTPSAMNVSSGETYEVQMARTLPHIYSECARIWNPIHSERAVALKAGLPDIIVHGTITWALAAREIAAHCHRDISALRRLTVRFRAPIVAGQPMRLRHDDSPVDGIVRFGAADIAGNVALADGLAQWQG